MLKSSIRITVVKISFFFLFCYFLEILDGIEDNAPEHHTNLQIFMNSSTGDHNFMDMHVIFFFNSFSCWVIPY